jgi:hypothetical protein
LLVLFICGLETQSIIPNLFFRTKTIGFSLKYKPIQHILDIEMLPINFYLFFGIKIDEVFRTIFWIYEPSILEPSQKISKHHPI